MAKVDIVTIQNLDNPSAAVGQINLNFDRIQAAIELLLSRDGEVPNSMLAFLDMNANRVINLPPPFSPTEPARHGDIQQYVDSAAEHADRAEDAQEAAEDAQEAAEDAQAAAEAALLDLTSRYIGPYPSSPSVSPDGSPLLQGAIYFNTTVNNWRVFALDDVHSEGEPVYAGSPAVLVGYWIPFPQASVRSQNDVDADAIANGQLLVWNSGTALFIPWSAIAGNISYDDSTTDLNAGTVQDAIEDLVARTSLGAFDIMCFAQDLLVENEQIFRLVAARQFWLPVGGGDSLAVSRVPSNGTQVLTLRRNGTQFGTITFTSSDEGVWSQAGTEVFNVGDVLSVTIGGNPDTNLRDISITFAARR